MMAAVMRCAGEAEAVRWDLVMGVLLIAGTDMPRLRKSKAPSPLRLLGRRQSAKTRKGGPSRLGRTARRVTWTCQEGSGSLLGNLIGHLVADQLLGFVINRRIFL